MADECPPTLLPQTLTTDEQPRPLNQSSPRGRGRGRPRRSGGVLPFNPHLSMSTAKLNQVTALASNVQTGLGSSAVVTYGKATGKGSTGPGRKYQKMKGSKGLETCASIDGEEEQIPPCTALRPSGKTADWDEFLSDGNNLKFIAPVAMFKHAPLRGCISGMVGRVFEAPNPFVRCSRPVNWFATTLHFAGYKALVEFENLGLKQKYLAWMSFCSSIPKPIGYSDGAKIVLHPPHEIRAEYPDYLSRAREALANKKSRITVSPDHGKEIEELIRETQIYKLHEILEVLDKTKISRMRVATVTGIVGDRIHVSYVIEPKPNDSGFWFNVKSDQVHPIGWSQTVEHEIYGVPISAKFTPLGLEYFPKYPEKVRLSKGEMLEVRHPVQPNMICAASVFRILKHGYIVVEIKVLPEEVKESTKFTFHITSPYILPCGFAETHGIKITPPMGESNENFSWDVYLNRLNLKKASLQMLRKRPTAKFKPGMKLEGIDISHPSYLGPCTVIRIAAHLIFIHFDGWKRDSPIDLAESWVDADSPDIYPIGYAEMVGHELQGCVEPANPEDVVYYQPQETKIMDNEKNDSTEVIEMSPGSPTVLA